MRVSMVKKKMADGSDCRKCADVTAYLQARGFWNRVDEVVWAYENDPESPGMVLGQRLGVERAPFSVIRDERGETVSTTPLQLIQERSGKEVSTPDASRPVEPRDEAGDGHLRG